jgi:hypothetical protein
MVMDQPSFAERPRRARGAVSAASVVLRDGGVASGSLMSPLRSARMMSGVRLCSTGFGS